MKVAVVDYRSRPGLDAELADCAFAAVAGWPDQRPIGPDLVASRLRPVHGGRPTALAVARRDERIDGWAAVRWPPPESNLGKLWGPAVRPEAQGRGLGHGLLELAAQKATTRLETAEIPLQREAALALFARAGWAESSRGAILRAPVPPNGNRPDVEGVRITNLRDASLSPARAASLVAGLFRELYPSAGAAYADRTLARWSEDRRFRPEGVVLALAGTELAAMALALPLADEAHAEKPEVLVADVAVAQAFRGLDAPLRRALVAAVLDVGRSAGATTARLVLTADQLAFRELYREAGFADVADTITFVS